MFNVWGSVQWWYLVLYSGKQECRRVIGSFRAVVTDIITRLRVKAPPRSLVVILQHCTGPPFPIPQCCFPIHRIKAVLSLGGNRQDARLNTLQIKDIFLVNKSKSFVKCFFPCLSLASLLCLALYALSSLFVIHVFVLALSLTDFAPAKISLLQ